MKDRREFYKTAVARIIADTETVTAYEYSDMELSKIEIQLFIHEAIQQNFTVIPELDENKRYQLNGEIFTGKEIMDEGIFIETPEWEDRWHHMIRVELTEVK